jgi:DNA-binding SARP family transcriptional activator
MRLAVSREPRHQSPVRVMRDRLQISVLGELKIAHDGMPMPLPASKKTRALLAYLAVVGRPVRRDNLCEMFWEGPYDPRANLRWSLHKIRKITNDDKWERLTADNSRVFLSPQTVDLDFRLVSQVRPIDIKELDTPALESLVEANMGRFLTDLPLPHCPKFEAWRLYHSAFVDSIRIQMLAVLIERTELWAKVGDGVKG